MRSCRPGGSAATASHFVCDLVKGARVAGIAPMRAFALAERNFAEQILALAEPEDIVVVISAGSNSPNILAALEAASSCGAWTIGLLGFDGGAAKELVDVAIHIPCRDYGLVEDTHGAIAHALTTTIRQILEASRA